MITEPQILIRLLIAAIMGALVGFERERHNQPAGLRTHTILAIGSSLAMCVSIDLAMQYQPAGAPNGDPARLAAQVISGIGFLGAGAIIRFGSSIKGLTTATSLWTVAIIGLAVGAGHYYPALTATVLLLATLVLLDKLEKRVIIGVSTRSISVIAIDHPMIINNFKNTLQTLDIEVKSISLSKNVETNELTIKALAKIRDQHSLDKLVGSLSNIEGLKTFGID